jgi:catechol 2,3-dioxygenase-like lactoylglutathione lyase family enzyme
MALQRSLGLISLRVRDCDEALDFYVGTLGVDAGRGHGHSRAAHALGASGRVM